MDITRDSFAVMLKETRDGSDEVCTTATDAVAIRSKVRTDPIGRSTEPVLQCGIWTPPAKAVVPFDASNHEERSECKQLTDSTFGSFPGHEVWNRLILGRNIVQQFNIALMTILDRKRLDSEQSIACFGELGFWSNRRVQRSGR